MEVKRVDNLRVCLNGWSKTFPCGVDAVVEFAGWKQRDRLRLMFCPDQGGGCGSAGLVAKIECSRGHLNSPAARHAAANP